MNGINRRRKAADQQSLMLEHALAYAARGLPIFPARLDKTPYTENGVMDATTNEAQIRAWWKRWPAANPALNCGEANLLVLDFDPGHDRAELERNVGKVPETRMVAKTPRGGTHEYYALKPGEIVPNSASKLAEHVDVRSFHGYVLLPPSRTADGIYEWIGEGKPAHRTDELRRVASVAREKSADRDNWIIPPNMPENVERCIQWLKEKAKPSIEGKGGDSNAYATAAMCKSFGISEELAFDLMLEHWNERCSPPWSWDEQDHLQQKVTNAYEFNTSPPGNMTKAYHDALAKAGFKPVAKASADAQQRGSYFQFADRMEMEHIRPAKWLIPDFLAQGNNGILFGAPGTYKSFLALDMVLPICTGVAGGLWPASDYPGPVLFAAGEGRPQITRRVRAWEKTYLGGALAKDFVLASPTPPVGDESLWNEFILGAKQSQPGGYRVVTIDTVARSMAGLDENSQQDAGRYTRLVDRLSRELAMGDIPCAVLGVHHTGLSNTDRVRGSNVFTGNSDMQARVERVAGKDRVATLRVTRQKDGAEWEKPMVVKLPKVQLSPDPEDNTLVVTKMAAAEATAILSETDDSSEAKQHSEIGYILAALRSIRGKTWTLTELAAEAHRRGCKIKPSTLRTKVLTIRDGKPGWAIEHRALRPYRDAATDTWITPLKLPEIDPAYAPIDEAGDQ